MTRVISFFVVSSHPDFVTVREQLVQARRLFNGLNAVARESFAYRRDITADMHLSKELGVEAFTQSKPNLGSTYGYEGLRKQIEKNKT